MLVVFFLMAETATTSRVAMRSTGSAPLPEFAFMLRAIRVGSVSFLWLSISFAALGQTSARLHTSETELAFEAGSTAPRLVTLTVSGQPAWENRASETLIASADVS